jgi:hypothetical protein
MPYGDGEIALEPVWLLFPALQHPVIGFRESDQSLLSRVDHPFTRPEFNAVPVQHIEIPGEGDSNALVVLQFICRKSRGRFLNCWAARLDRWHICQALPGNDVLIRVKRARVGIHNHSVSLFCHPARLG